MSCVVIPILCEYIGVIYVGFCFIMILLGFDLKYNVFILFFNKWWFDERVVNKNSDLILSNLFVFFFCYFKIVGICFSYYLYKKNDWLKQFKYLGFSIFIE